MRVRWQRAASDPKSVTYYVDDVAVGADDAGFDRVLELIDASQEGVTLGLSELPVDGGGSLRDLVPFDARFDELERCIGDRGLSYGLY
jgi:hypothetical protein